MNITFAPRGILQIDDARIVHRNFAGAPSKFNREGDRNFSVVIPDEETADKLINDINQFGAGWNVKIKPPRDEDDSPFIYLPVKIKFNNNGPAVYLRTNGKMVPLNEDTIACLDDVDILSVDLDIRPYDDEFNGRAFRSAYLHSMCVTQNVDRHMARYAAEEGPCE